MKKIFNSSISDNGFYPYFCKIAATDDNLFQRFKNADYRYNEILEHCSYEQGRKYLDWIISVKGIEDTIEIIEAASINDKIGSSICYSYSVDSQSQNIFRISPSTLRYAKVAIEIETLFGEISNLSVCEIGGGYGGQCLVFDSLYGFSKWDIVDIEEANFLQRKYLESNLVVGTKQVDITRLSELDSKYDLVISNYAFSECKRDIQDVYMNRIIKNANKGYMTMNYCWTDNEQGKDWCHTNGFENMMDEKDIIKEIPSLLVKEEVPNTHPKNCIYYWNKH